MDAEMDIERRDTERSRSVEVSKHKMNLMNGK